MSDIPGDLKFLSSHEWARVNDDGTVTIGISDHAQSQLGDIIFFESPEIGSVVKAGDVFGEIEAVKTVSELYARISGKITSINEIIENKPEIINLDPYGKGWLIKISPLDLEEKKKLMVLNLEGLILCFLIKF